MRGAAGACASLAAIMLVAGLSCAGSRRIETRQIEEVEGEGRVLIVTRGSDFKSQILDRLIEDYRQRATLKIVHVRELRHVRPGEYDAMILMDSRRGFLLFNGRVKRFLRRTEDKDKLILVMTAAMSNWEWDREDIDVITSASVQKNIDPIYDEMSERLDALLER